MTLIEQLAKKIIDTSQPITTRRAAIIEVAGIGGDEALPILLEALSDSAPSVRREAVNAIQGFNSQDVTPTIVDALYSEENDLTLWKMIEVLGQIGSSDALPKLKVLFKTAVSPLTKREVQKSIQLIESRSANDDSSKKTEPTSVKPQTKSEITTPSKSFVDIPEPTDKNDEITGQDVEYSKASLVESDDEHDQVMDTNDDVIEDSSESFTVDDDNTESDVVEQPIIELSIEQDEEMGSVSTDSSETVTTEDGVRIQNDDPKVEQPIDSDIEVQGRRVSSPALPVLVPNTSVVIYEQDDDRFQPSVYDIMLRPNTYLSKRWISRTRLYLVLVSLLLASTIVMVYSQVQRQPRSPYRHGYEKAFVPDPQRHYEDGNLFIQQANFRRAIDVYELIRSVDNINPLLYKNLGYAYFQENQYALATEAYNYFLQTRQKETFQPFVAEAAYSENGSEDESSDYTIYNILGTAYRNLGQFDNARFSFEKAITIAPNEAEAYSNLAQLYSYSYQQKNLLAEALGYAAVRLNPGIAATQDTLGSILGRNGRLNKATDLLAQAVRLQSDYYPAHYHLSLVAQKSSQPEKALNIIESNLKKYRRSKQTRSTVLDILSYNYEKKARNIEKFLPSLYNLRGIKR